MEGGCLSRSELDRKWDLGETEGTLTEMKLGMLVSNLVEKSASDSQPVSNGTTTAPRRRDWESEADLAQGGEHTRKGQGDVHSLTCCQNREWTAWSTD